MEHGTHMAMAPQPTHRLPELPHRRLQKQPHRPPRPAVEGATLHRPNALQPPWIQRCLDEQHQMVLERPALTPLPERELPSDARRLRPAQPTEQHHPDNERTGQNRDMDKHAAPLRAPPCRVSAKPSTQEKVIRLVKQVYTKIPARSDCGRDFLNLP